MTTSEVRRGPGWWMDVEGMWNPPEVWPEETPPLPGWIQNEEGAWYDPDPAPEAPAEDETTPVVTYAKPTTGKEPADVEPVDEREPENETSPPVLSSLSPLSPAVGAQSKTDAGRASLTFAEHVAPDPAAVRGSKPAVNAALLAALITVMLAAGLIVLLSV